MLACRQEAQSDLEDYSRCGMRFHCCPSVPVPVLGKQETYDGYIYVYCEY